MHYETMFYAKLFSLVISAFALDEKIKASKIQERNGISFIQFPLFPFDVFVVYLIVFCRVYGYNFPLWSCKDYP